MTGMPRHLFNAYLQLAAPILPNVVFAGLIALGQYCAFPDDRYGW